MRPFTKTNVKINYETLQYKTSKQHIKNTLNNPQKIELIYFESIPTEQLHT